MTNAPAPRLTVTVTPEQREAWQAARRTVDVVRDRTGRVATVAGAAGAVTVIAAPGTWWQVLAATAALTAAGTGVLRLQMPHAGHQKATATALYAAPGVGLGVLLIAERITAGAAWSGTLAMQLLAAAAWTAGVWLLRPGRVARRMATPPPPRPAAPAGTVPADDHPAAVWWAEHVAGGVAPGTVLEGIERTGERAMRAIIRATTPGQPVPDISIRRLSALLDIPEDDITIGPVPGRGAGVRRLTIGTPDAAVGAVDPTTVWAEQIAPLAMPGAALVSIRVGTPGAEEGA